MKINNALSQLLEINGVSDVLLQGADHTFIFDGNWKQVANPFRDEAKLRQQIIDLVLATGKRWDIARPHVDFSIENFRFHALMGGVVSLHDQLSIRIHKTDLDFQLAPKLELIAKSNESFLISGPTGSGKTTLLAKMLKASPGRTVLIEQTAEIELPPPSASIRSRESNIELAGELTMSELLNQALRMRPDRVVIGEIRGKEALALLLAINNGHKGAAATIHAQSAKAVPNRLRTLGLMAGVAGELMLDLAGSIDWLIHVDNTELQGIYRWQDL